MTDPRHAAAPGCRTEGGAGDHQGAGSLTSLPSASDSAPAATLPTITPEQAADAARGAFVVVTYISSDRFRRRVFLTLKAAERAAERAQEKGHQAHVLLARIEPLAVVGAIGAPVAEGVVSR